MWNGNSQKKYDGTAPSEIQMKIWFLRHGQMRGGRWPNEGRTVRRLYRNYVWWNFLSNWHTLVLNAYTVPIIPHFACPKVVLAVKMSFKVEIPLFKGFVLPTHFQKQVGWGTWLGTRCQRWYSGSTWPLETGRPGSMTFSIFSDNR